MKFLFQFLPADAATVISSIATVCEDLSLSPIFHDLCRNFGLKTKQFSAEMGPPEFHNKVGEKFPLFD